MELTLGQLAVQIGGTLHGGGADTPVIGVAGYDTVADGEVTYITQPRLLPDIEATEAVAIIAPPAVTRSTKPLIIVEDPRSAFGRALGIFDWRRPPLPGIDPSAVIAQSAGIHAGAHIGAFVSVGANAIIGDGCIIYPHAVIGDHVEIGPGTIVYPQVTIYPRCTIGQRVILHAGAVIGADGFGYQPGPQGAEKIPHLGTVIIEDDVEIGANTTVDRATTGQTVIGRGTKIDNQVQVAHNVVIGPHCLFASQVGIAGSSTVGAGVIMGGQAGLGDHVHVGNGVRVAGQSGVSKDVPDGITVSGYPAQPHQEQLRYEAALRRVPALLKQIKALEKRLAELEGRLSVPAEEETV